MTDVEHERDDSRLRQHVKLHPDAIIQLDSAFSFCPLTSLTFIPRLLNENDPFHLSPILLYYSESLSGYCTIVKLLLRAVES